MEDIMEGVGISVHQEVDILAHREVDILAHQEVDILDQEGGPITSDLPEDILVRITTDHPDQDLDRIIHHHHHIFILVMNLVAVFAQFCRETYSIR